MKQKLRPAVAMIELIFALVIMGIVLLSAPRLISTAAESSYVAIQQEAINEASSHVNMVLGYYWDEVIADDILRPVVLHVTAGQNDLDENGTSGRRKGTPIQSLRSFIRFDGEERNATAVLGSEGDSDDVDDFIGDTNLTLIDASTADYVESDTIKISTLVSYIADGNASTYTPNGTNIINFNPDLSSTPGGSTNIKGIRVTLTSDAGIDELNKTIVFEAFSSNIGSSRFEERAF